jgi:hypothetical protein
VRLFVLDDATCIYLSPQLQLVEFVCGGKRKVLSVVPSLGTYIQRGVSYASAEGRDLGGHRFYLLRSSLKLLDL